MDTPTVHGWSVDEIRKFIVGMQSLEDHQRQFCGPLPLPYKEIRDAIMGRGRKYQLGSSSNINAFLKSSIMRLCETGKVYSTVDDHYMSI